MVGQSFNLKNISNYCGKHVCKKGAEYLNTDALYLCYKDKTSIVAFCEGYSMPTYRIWIEFDTSGIVDSKCTCKRNLIAPCKHIAAVLLTWYYKPEKFFDRSDLPWVLQQKKDPDLVQVIEKLLDYCHAEPISCAQG